MDDELGELFLEGEEISVEQLMAAIRRSTVRAPLLSRLLRICIGSRSEV